MLCEISQTEEEGYCMISLICGIRKKKKTQSKRPSLRFLEVGGRGMGRLEEGGQKVETSSYKRNRTTNIMYNTLTTAHTAV